MADIERILIVGGGIAGLSLATALHQEGFHPELIERSTAWPAIGGRDQSAHECCAGLASARPR
jgi:2-polyprenyl-6-methoxyphenol hydroxylase-like FAD-dependent oxidoreductase